jgi:hypothetical protein
VSEPAVVERGTLKERSAASGRAGVTYVHRGSYGAVMHSEHS